MSEVGERHAVTPEVEQQVERLSGAIYGTIIVAGILAATSNDDEPSLVDTAIYVFSTVVVFWLAHAWADSLARRVVATRQGLRGFRITLANQWPLVQSALPPIAVMLVASAFGADDVLALDIAAWSCVALLAGWGVAVARRERESLLGILRTSAVCAGLGLLMIVLKVALG